MSNKIFEDVVFTEKEMLDNRTLTGWFPMYVVAWKKGNEYNKSLPYNPMFRIDEAAAELKGTHPNGEHVSAANMVGKIFKGKGVWITKQPKTTEDKKKNIGWMNWFNSLSGFSIPVNKEGHQQLFEPESPHDVLGFKCMGHIELVPRKDDRDKPVEEQRRYPTVTEIKPYEGENTDRIDPDIAEEQFDAWEKERMDTPY